ncbi:MAG: DinB family protein [Bryobacterales bacterium]|nr:DinB family protein [Bryobacterales bacterium]
MRTILKFVAVPMLCVLAAQAEPLAKGERDRAMSYLHATRKQFVDAIRGVTPEQARWKPAPGRWSVAEVVEHIAVSEEFIFKLVTGQILKGSPATPEQKALTAGKDATIPARVTDRSQKFQAPEPITPAGRFASLEAAEKEFLSARDRSIRFIEKTDLSLRDYVRPHPAMKELDAYQWILLMAAHTERHLKQLQEVKDSPGYPRR